MTDERTIPTGSRWQHRKGGEYVVLGLCRDEESRQLRVIYVEDDGRPRSDPPWGRPLAAFVGGRFTRLDDPDRPATDSRRMYEDMCRAFEIKREHWDDPVVVGTILGHVGAGGEGPSNTGMVIAAVGVAKAYWAAELGRLRAGHGYGVWCGPMAQWLVHPIGNGSVAALVFATEGEAADHAARLGPGFAARPFTSVACHR